MKSRKSKNKNNDCLAAAGTAAQSRDSNGAVSLKICKEVAQIYSWIDSSIKNLDPQCSACGKCCDFESFGHKLFITTPELLCFYENLKPLRKMTGQSCPYLEDGKCTVRDFRFAGCRIFFCKTDTERQNQLSEIAVGKFKAICDKFNLPYSYVDLRTALNSPELAKLVGL